MNGWQAICGQLEQLGVEVVFGIPGTQNAELFSELALTNIRIVSLSSEKSAAFAAIGYAIGSGKPSVLLTIAGPGFCYTAAPLVEAVHDSVPLINIVIGNAEKPDRPFQHQSVDHDGLAERLAKATRRVLNGAELLPALEWAWCAASSGEPGPVVIFVDGQTLNEQQIDDAFFELKSDSAPPSADIIEEVFNQVAGKQVLILAGRGAAEARQELKRLVHENNWPIMTTMSGRGVLTESDPLCLMTEGCPVASVNAVIKRMDVILVVGAKLTHNGSFGFQLDLPAEKLIHVDTSDGVLNANYETRLAIRCGAQQFCLSLADYLIEQRNQRSPSIAGDLQEILNVGRQDESLEPQFKGENANAREFFSALQKTFPRDTSFVTDSGYHQFLARRHLVAYKPNQIVCPIDFQSMGFGIPSAIGLALARPDCNVVAVHGDGGFHMCAMDLLSAAKEKLPLVVCVLDDGYYGLIRMQQLSSGNLESGVQLPQLDFERLAGALGIGYAKSLKELTEQQTVAGNNCYPIILHQPIVETSEQKGRYSSARTKGRIRRALGPKVTGWVKKVRRS